MSLAEMKQKAISLINKVESEKKLKQLLKILEENEPKPSIEQIFEEAKAQYGNTLKKLSE
jgi:hypothetical protein